MIVPDVNLLVHAYNSGSQQHGQAKLWLEGLLNGRDPVGLSWVVIMGYLRVTTHHRMMTNPLSAQAACSHAQSWLSRPNVSPLSPGRRHSQIFFTLLTEIGIAGNLTTDAHIAALAIEYNAEVHTTDADFSRFSGLKWSNPLR